MSTQLHNTPPLSLHARTISLKAHTLIGVKSLLMRVPSLSQQAGGYDDGVCAIHSWDTWACVVCLDPDPDG